MIGFFLERWNLTCSTKHVIFVWSEEKELLFVNEFCTNILIFNMYFYIFTLLTIHLPDLTCNCTLPKRSRFYYVSISKVIIHTIRARGNISKSRANIRFYAISFSSWVLCRPKCPLWLNLFISLRQGWEWLILCCWVQSKKL